MAEKKNFEQMMARLDEITEKLEGKDLSLTDSMKLFEEGVSLTKRCNDLLSEAEQKIVKITEQSDGAYTEEPFGVEEN